MAEYISFQPSDYFNTKLYTGTDTSGTGTVTGVGFQPDLVWGKVRSKVGQHNLYDAVRGGGKRLIPNGTDATETDAAYGYLSAFDSDGFTTTAGSSNNENFNETSETFASWNWKMGTTSGLTGGTITPSAYSINTTAGQSVIAYTGTGSVATIPHGLAATPGLIITKSLVATQEWCVYHKSLGATKYIFLNENSASGTSSAYYNDVEPTSTLFTIGTAGPTNSSSAMIAYCFTPITGYSKFKGYIGNANADGPFVYTGFRPAFLLLKKSESTGDWMLFDNKRLGYNVDNNNLNPNLTGAEGTTDYVDILSNGFKIRTTDALVNAVGTQFIYAAFAESPIVSSNDTPGVAR
jgi:hypothetical protein